MWAGSWERGPDELSPSYGTLVSDFKRSGGGDAAEEKAKTGKDDVKGKGKAKVKPKKKQGLYEVEWFRIGGQGSFTWVSNALTSLSPVLDEAHSCKNRSTQNAKASYALRGDRRWCLTGTPIVKFVFQIPSQSRN